VTLRRVASLAGALIVATIAALASYSHMRGLAMRYGQPELIADLLPVSVDGMMVTATVALGDGRRYRWSAWLAFWTGVAASVIANVLAAQPSGIARCISAWPAVAFLLVVEVITRGGRTRPHDVASTSDALVSSPMAEPTAAPGQHNAEMSTSSASAPGPSAAAPSRRTGAKTVRRPIAETQELAAHFRADHPAITQAELARLLGISATRLRQVERAGQHGRFASRANGPEFSDDDDLPA
jgi:Protein of unknown function (DUF2637)